MRLTLIKKKVKETWVEQTNKQIKEKKNQEKFKQLIIPFSSIMSQWNFSIQVSMHIWHALQGSFPMSTYFC